MGLKVKVATLDGLDEPIRALYIKAPSGDGYILDADGVEDVTGLKNTLDRQKDELKEFKGLVSKYKELGDPEIIKTIMARMENDEDTRLIAEGKVDQVIEKRTAKQREALERKVKEAEDKAKAESDRATKYEQRVLDDQLRAAAMNAGLHPSAVEDVLFRGRAIFKLSEEGEAFQPGDDGKPILGKDGKTNFNPTEWLGGMKEKAPHWFPANGTGGGAGGSGNAATRGRDLSKLSPVERMNAARGVS